MTSSFVVVLMSVCALGCSGGGGERHTPTGGDTSTSDSHAPAGVGDIKLSSSDRGFYAQSAFRAFTDPNGEGGVDSTCTEEPAGGGCVFARCGGSMSVKLRATRYVSAGAVSVDVEGSTAVPLVPGAFAPISSNSGVRALWKGGEKIVVRAAGAADGVGPFGVEVVAPAQVRLDAPAYAPKAAIEIARDVDSRFAWRVEGQAGGDVEITIAANYFEGGSQITCRAPSSAGELIIPKAVLARLPAADGISVERGDPTATLRVAVFSQKTVTVGQMPIKVDARWPARSSAGESVEYVAITLR